MCLHMYRLAEWTKTSLPQLNDDAKELIMRMTQLDPATRAPMSAIVTDPYWDKLEEPPKVRKECPGANL